jgi:hypothetical protein
MRLLVKNQKEKEPKEPVIPADKEEAREAKSPFEMKKYKTELKQHYSKKERYEGVGPHVGGFFTRSCDNFLS